MPRLFPITICLALAACGTPQERCINSVTRDLRVVNRLITETETNLSRGFRLEDVTTYRTVWVDCYPAVIVVQPDGSEAIAQAPRMCLDDEAVTIQRPRAIDPAEERRKLDGLKAQRAKLSRQAEPSIAQCRALHPE